MTLTRRSLTAGLALALSGAGPRVVQAATKAAGMLAAALAQIEAAAGGRLGVALLDTSTGFRAGHRAAERFPICSTFKVLASGAILARVDAGQEQVSRRVRFTASDLVTSSPITKDRVGGDGMTLAELCAAAIDYSDNTAGNMLLRQIGGPAGLTAFARSLGDPVTRLDRIETALNEALPDDPRDTTAPDAMLADLQALTLGSALSPPSRNQLVAWLKANTTGGTRLRAGLPKDWQVGDKTGTGDQGTANDVAVIWPPDRKPILITVYLTGATVSAAAQSAAIAAVGKAVAAALPSPW
ncbi:MAG TPA: class A beta-lactamase [Lichenihabitans sp.]|nr:class A beta-lactamase [Lichenihabitans sp.]